MDREKEIEEIANILWHIPNNYYYYLNSYNDCKRIAECIYDDGGYRKQSEVAKEIFDEIERILSLNYCCCLPQGATEHYEYYEGNIAKDIAELKKKYAGEKEDE